MNKLIVCSPRDNVKPSDNNIIINTTSRSTNWSKGLSPFLLGPIALYDGYVAKKVENAWQYSKVYSEVNNISMIDEESNPNENYFTWAKNGWQDSYANRYPAGKGVQPLYSYWNGQKLSYVEARKKIYIPIYATAVLESQAYKQLQDLYDSLEENKTIYLWDFDGYNHKKLNMSYKDVVNCETKKMGHAFVLAMLLEGIQ